MKVKPSNDTYRYLPHSAQLLFYSLSLWFCNLEMKVGEAGWDCQVVNANPTLPKLQQKRVHRDPQSYSGVLLISVRPLGYSTPHRGTRALAFPGCVLGEESVVYPKAKKAPRGKKKRSESSGRLAPRAPASRM